MGARVQANDYFKLTSRSVTDEGFLVAPGRLARTGIQEYRAYELGLDSVPPMKIIRLYRPAEEVFAPDSMRSFEGKPITIEHPPEDVTAANWKEYATGDVRSIGRDGEFMTATLTVKSKEAIEAIDSGKKELSNGYSFTLDMTPGVAPDGSAYDGVQRNIRGNHIALVDAARCGSACRIADSKPVQPGDKPMTTVKKVVDGIPLEVSETAAAAIDKLIGERDSARAEAKTAKDSVAGMIDPKVHADTIAAKDAEIETLKKDVMTPDARDAMVADWTKMIGDAKRLVPEIETAGKTCLAIRKEVISTLSGKDATAKAVADAILAGRALDSIDADTARGIFNALAASVKVEANDGGQDQNDDVANALSGKDSKPAVGVSGRDKFLAKSAQAWQQ